MLGHRKLIKPECGKWREKYQQAILQPGGASRAWRWCELLYLAGRGQSASENVEVSNLPEDPLQKRKSRPRHAVDGLSQLFRLVESDQKLKRGLLVCFDHFEQVLRRLLEW